MGALSRETWIGVAGSVLAVGAMAADHLLEDEGDFPADVVAFVVAVAVIALVAIVLFAVVVPRARGDGRRAATAGLACSVLAVVAFPVTAWLGPPFVLAAAGVALGLRARRGERRGRAVAAVALGALVLAVGTAAYAAVAVDKLA